MFPIAVQVASNFIIAQGDVDRKFDVNFIIFMLVVGDTRMIIPDVRKLLILLMRMVLGIRGCVEGLQPTRRAQQMPSIITIYTTLQLLLHT